MSNRAPRAHRQHGTDLLLPFLLLSLLLNFYSDINVVLHLSHITHGGTQEALQHTNTASSVTMSEHGGRAIEIANELHNLVAQLDHQLASERKTNAEQAAEIGVKEERLIEGAEQLQKMIKWYGDAIKGRETPRTQTKVCQVELDQVRGQLKQANSDNLELWKRMNQLEHNFALVKSAWCDDNVALRAERQTSARLQKVLAMEQDQGKSLGLENKRLNEQIEKAQRITEAARLMLEKRGGSGWQEYTELLEALKQAVGDD